jgi:hypothetical protein
VASLHISDEQLPTRMARNAKHNKSFNVAYIGGVVAAVQEGSTLDPTRAGAVEDFTRCGRRRRRRRRRRRTLAVVGLFGSEQEIQDP